MDKNKKSKNIILIVIILAIVGIAVGYAALSQTLTLNGRASVASASEWNVHFLENSAAVKSTNGGVTGEQINLDSGLLTGTFTATLEPGASVVYKVSVVNDGSIEAALSGAPTISGESANISCTVTPTSQNTTLSSSNNNQHDYEITVTCAEMSQLPETAETANITVQFNYEQAN